MAIEQETNTNNKESLKEFKNLLDQDFKDRQVKENVIITGVVTEITKNKKKLQHYCDVCLTLFVMKYQINYQYI